MTKFLKRQFIAEEHQQKQNNTWHRLIGRSIVLPILLLFVIIFAGFSYLFYVNQTATGSFAIKGLESHITELQDASKKLELQTAEMQSLSNVEAGIQDLQMVAVSRIEYLPAVGAAVAVR
jgi:hypothetical protein